MAGKRHALLDVVLIKPIDADGIMIIWSASAVQSPGFIPLTRRLKQSDQLI